MQKEDQKDALAHRIEETLVAREKERLEILASQPQIEAVALPKKCRKGVSFTLLALGFLLGGLIGGLCYMLLPAPQATASSPATAPPLPTSLAEADRLLAAGQQEAARARYLDVLRQNPQSVEALNNLAVLAAAEGDLTQAREHLDRALKTSPAYQAVHANIARIYAGMARNSYGKALQLSDDLAPVKLMPLVIAEADSRLALEPPVPAAEEGSRKDLPAATSSLPVASTTSPVAVDPVAAPAPAVDSMPAAVKPDPVAIKSPEVVAASKPVSMPLLAKLETKDMRPATPVSDPVASPTPQQFLDLWASAWSKQKVKSYLSFYASNYFSPRLASRSKWEDQRRKRLTKPSFIQVELNDFVVTEQSDQQVEVQMVQSYQSDNYRDKTRKLMVLERRDASWQIVDERTLERFD